MDARRDCDKQERQRRQTLGSVHGALVASDLLEWSRSRHRGQKSACYRPGGCCKGRAPGAVAGGGVCVLSGTSSGEASSRTEEADTTEGPLRPAVAGGSCCDGGGADVLAMVPAALLGNWQWASLARAATGGGGGGGAGGWPVTPRRPMPGTARPPWTRTPRRVGVSVADLWSLYELSFGAAGHPGARRWTSPCWPAAPRPAHRPGRHVRGDAPAAAPAARGLLPEGPRAEAPRGRERAAWHCSPWAPWDYCWRWRTRQRNRIESGGKIPPVGDRFVVRPGEKIATDGAGGNRGISAVDTDRRLIGARIPLEVTAGAHGDRRSPSASADAWWCARQVAPTRNWPRSPGWLRMPRLARRRYSG